MRDATWFRRSHIRWTILVVAATEGIMLIPILLGWATFDPKIGIVAFATMPAFAVTIIQLIRTQQVQRAAYVKDFLTEFRKNNELFAAYYDLVYPFRDDVFDRIDEALQEYLRSNPDPPAESKPIFDCFQAHQTTSEPGCRFYHPLVFQFSPEERKLDGLLDYFNAIGLYLYEGLIRIEDVVTVLGDYLAVITDRKAVQVYLDLCNDPEKWKYDERVGASLPYQHLRYLIESYKEYNLHEYNRRRAIQLQHAIKSKEKEVAELRHQLRQQT